MKHAVPVYLEWWRAYLTLSYGCSQLMLKSMQQVLDAGVAAWVYRPVFFSPSMSLPAMAPTHWIWSAAMLPASPWRGGIPRLCMQPNAVDKPELNQVMAQVIRLVATPRK